MVGVEGDLRFDFSSAIKWRKFDDPTHGLSHCMKAVDFIVEVEHALLFVEVKDPQHPSAKRKDRDEFVKRLQSTKLILENLVPKCRDSFLYEHAFKNDHKPVKYLVLIALDSLTEADLLNQTDCLRNHLPVDGPPGNHWPRKFVDGCVMMNLSTWEKHFPQFPVARLSEKTAG